MVNNVSVACGDCKAYYKIHWRLLIWEVSSGETRQLWRPEKVFRKKKKKVQEPYLQEYVAQIPILLIFDLTARLPNRTPAGWGGCRGCSTGEDLAAHSFPVPMAQQPLSLWAAPGHQCPEPPRLTFISSLSRCYDRLGNLCIPQDTIVVWSWVLKQHFLLFWLTSICSLPLPHFILRSGFV